MSKTGDCVVKHPTNFTTGFAMVVSVSCALSVFLAVLEQLEIEQVCEKCWKATPPSPLKLF